MALERGYYEIRFNLTREKAWDNIKREVAKTVEQARLDGKTESEIEAISAEKHKELDAFWFTWKTY